MGGGGEHCESKLVDVCLRSLCEVIVSDSHLRVVCVK